MLVFARLFLLFGLLIFELAIIKQTAHRRNGGGCHLHQIHTLILGYLDSFTGWYNTQLLTIRTYKANFWSPDTIVNADLFSYAFLPSKNDEQISLIPQNAPESQRAHNLSIIPLTQDK
jgi:hypothetical protein